ncbi:6731_t:CDS:1, partial [Dentiscutata heterogama]
SNDALSDEIEFDRISDGKYEVIVSDYLRAFGSEVVLPLLSLLLARRKSSFVV